MIEKRVFFILLLVFLLFYSFYVLTAEPLEYYPMDLGNIAVLETEDGTERIIYTVEATEERFDGKEVVLLRRKAETLGTDDTTGEVFFLHFDEAGAKLYKVIAELGSVFGTATAVLSPPVLFLPASLEIGDSWNVTLETVVKLSGPLSVSSVYEVIAMENVITSAGTFESCLKVQIESRTESRLGVTRTTSYQWLAWNVGIVKLETDQEIVFSLVSSNLLTDTSPYDVTGDGVVNILDIIFVASRLGDMSTDGDVNADGVVNILDLVLIAQNLSD